MNSSIRIHGTLRQVYSTVAPSDGAAAIHFQLACGSQMDADVRGRKLLGTGPSAQFAAAAAVRRLRRGLPCTVHAAGWAVDKDLGQMVLVGVDVIDQNVQDATNPTNHSSDTIGTTTNHRRARA